MIGLDRNALEKDVKCLNEYFKKTNCSKCNMIDNITILQNHKSVARKKRLEARTKWRRLAGSHISYSLNVDANDAMSDRRLS